MGVRRRRAGPLDHAAAVGIAAVRASRRWPDIAHRSGGRRRRMVASPPPHSRNRPVLSGILARVLGPRWDPWGEAACLLRRQCPSVRRASHDSRPRDPAGRRDAWPRRRGGRALRAVWAGDRDVLHTLEGRGPPDDVGGPLAARRGRGRGPATMGTPRIRRTRRRGAAGGPCDEGNERGAGAHLAGLAWDRALGDPGADDVRVLRDHLFRGQPRRHARVRRTTGVFRARRAGRGGVHAGVLPRRPNRRHGALSDRRLGHPGFRVLAAARGGCRTDPGRRPYHLTSPDPLRWHLDGRLARRLPALARDIRVLPTSLRARGGRAGRRGHWGSGSRRLATYHGRPDGPWRGGSSQRPPSSGS